MNGSKRTYHLHVPPGLEQNYAIPVVLVFHEDTYSVSQTRRQTHFDDVADANRFITIYPVGFGTSWNAGICCGIAMEDNVDDVQYVRQILSDLGTIARVDPKRIYATGFSNGAMFTYRLGCEMSDMFAAIAPVEGPQVLSPCHPKQPVSILHIHGLSDLFVPYVGGLNDKFPIMPPVEQGIEIWTHIDGCLGAPQVLVDGAITHTIYPCPPGMSIELYTLDGMEHAWPHPSGSGELNFPATQTIWDFFAAHPKIDGE